MLKRQEILRGGGKTGSLEDSDNYIAIKMFCFKIEN